MFNIFKKDKEKEVERKYIGQDEVEKSRDEKARQEKIKQELEKMEEEERMRKEKIEKEKRLLELQNQEEWVWVEGYKGMSKDMTGYGGFQFEIGKTYEIEGIIEECNNGFHFSLNLKDVITKHYGLQDGNRFFKVKALVRKKDLDKYGHIIQINDYYYGSREVTINKLVSREMIILEELDDETVFEEIKDCSKWLETLEDFRYCKEYGETKLAKSKLNARLIKLGINELLVKILMDKLERISTKEMFVVYVEALMQENISRDMLVYLMIEENKRLKGM